jgi:lysyl endopeptidase
MRRKVQIVVGVCAALVLTGSSGLVAWRQVNDPDGRPVGTWQEAPGELRTPMDLLESAPTEKTAAGRQRVGERLPVDKRLGYAGQTFRYPGASYVKLHFSRMVLRPGDHLTVSGGKGQDFHRYESGAGRWAMSITGDTAVVRVHRGAAGRTGTMDVRVDRVARGFTPAQQSRLAGPTGREESVCAGDQSTDAVCYRSAEPVAYIRSKAIARLLIDGTELCTGWRIGTSNRMLTNNHCFDNSKAAHDTEIWFNYQCVKCGAKAATTPTKVTGGRVLATDRTYDFTLFTVQNFARVRKYGHLDLDTVRPKRGQELYVPQHPAGAPVRIAGALGEAAGTCAVRDNAADGYSHDSDISYLCDTAGGSSGSPVLSRKTNKVVALHHFGGCPNAGVRADLLYTKLKSLL